MNEKAYVILRNLRSQVPSIHPSLKRSPKSILGDAMEYLRTQRFKREFPILPEPMRHAKTRRVFHNPEVYLKLRTSKLT